MVEKSSTKMALTSFLGLTIARAINWLVKMRKCISIIQLGDLKLLKCLRIGQARPMFTG